MSLIDPCLGCPHDSSLNDTSNNRLEVMINEILLRIDSLEKRVLELEDEVYHGNRRDGEYAISDENGNLRFD